MKRIWNSLRLAFSMYSIIPARQTEKTKEKSSSDHTTAKNYLYFHFETWFLICSDPCLWLIKKENLVIL